MTAAYSSKVFVCIHHTTCHQIPEDRSSIVTTVKSSNLTP